MGNVYSGFNLCHKSCTGITVAKLIHGVVCYKDGIYGANGWKWDDHDIADARSEAPEGNSALQGMPMFEAQNDSQELLAPKESMAPINQVMPMQQ